MKFFKGLYFSDGLDKINVQVIDTTYADAASQRDDSLTKTLNNLISGSENKIRPK